MRRGWQLTSLAFLALSVRALVHSLEFPLNDSLGPGPGFFPFWLSLIGGGLAIVLLVQVTWAGVEAAAGGSLIPDRPAASRVGRVLVSLVGVVVLLTPLGFRLTALLFIGYVLIALGVRTWWLIAVLAVAGSFGVFHVFYHWLTVPLPVGVLGI
jgi:putative tricarboxylic transport membrane protein